MKNFLIKFSIFVFIFISGISQIYSEEINSKEYEDFIKKGNSFYEKSKFKEAGNWYISGLNILLKDKTKYIEDIAMLNNFIGVCFFYQNDFDSALKYFQEALPIYEKDNNMENLSNLYSNIANSYFYKTDYEQALIYFKKVLPYYAKINNDQYLINIYTNIGSAYYYTKDYKNYVEMSKILHDLYVKNNNNDYAVSTLIGIANGYYLLTDFTEAQNYYSKTIEFSNKIKNQSGLMYAYNGLANVFNATGKYDVSFDYYEKSRELSEKYKDFNNLLLNVLGLGNTYFVWGDYDEALKKYENAVLILEKNKLNYYKPTIFDKLARVYWAKKDFPKAAETIQKVIESAKELKKVDEETEGINSLGALYLDYYQYSKDKQFITDAKNNFFEALTLAEKYNLKNTTARLYIHLGGCFLVENDYKNALLYFDKGLKLTTELNDLIDKIVCLNDIGYLNYNNKKYSEAVKSLVASNDIIEKMRLTAHGEQRRTYLSSQIKNYQFLAFTYFFDKNPSESFNITESSRAKYLLDKLSEKLSTGDFKFSGIENYKKNLADDEIIISFANTNYDEFIKYSINNKQVEAVSNKYDDFFEKVSAYIVEIESDDSGKLRGLIKTKKKEVGLPDNSPKKEVNSLTGVIEYYKKLLSKQNRTDKEQQYVKLFAKELWNLFFADLKDKFESKKTVIIIPDGILNILPFETLIMPDGKYFIEKYNIKYVQSLSVEELINKRKYSSNRKGLLAFGGADYKTFGNVSKIKNQKEYQAVISESYDLIERGRNLRNSYLKLGIGEWADLPGTLTEVKNIKEINKDSTIITGKDVNEKKVKDFSKNNDLSNYKIIHFATHGVVPEIAELSALVLSQNVLDDEDGYLTMKEISLLNINADFVNLSACETGLGKLYDGEGMVGLTQSFLIAGANSLSVSLWQVADDSTMEFMTDLYSNLAETRNNYFIAINDIKRKFIKEGKYSDPFYWAPFVYYGK